MGISGTIRWYRVFRNRPTSRNTTYVACSIFGEPQRPVWSCRSKRSAGGGGDGVCIGKYSGGCNATNRVKAVCEPQCAIRTGRDRRVHVTNVERDLELGDHAASRNLADPGIRVSGVSGYEPESAIRPNGDVAYVATAGWQREFVNGLSRQLLVRTSDRTKRDQH
jgi:hypothetical protein